MANRPQLRSFLTKENFAGSFAKVRRRRWKKLSRGNLLDAKNFAINETMPRATRQDLNLDHNYWHNRRPLFPSKKSVRSEVFPGKLCPKAPSLFPIPFKPPLHSISQSRTNNKLRNVLYVACCLRSFSLFWIKAKS